MIVNSAFGFLISDYREIFLSLHSPRFKKSSSEITKQNTFDCLDYHFFFGLRKNASNSRELEIQE